MAVGCWYVGTKIKKDELDHEWPQDSLNIILISRVKDKSAPKYNLFALIDERFWLLSFFLHSLPLIDFRCILLWNQIFIGHVRLHQNYLRSV